MTKKIWKVLFILTIVLAFGITYVSATDINLNLPNQDANQAVDNQTNDNPNQEANNINDNQDDQNTDADTENGDDYSVPTDFESLQPTASSNSSSGLSVTNIINILLITVGVILILLAIAIIIRLK